MYFCCAYILSDPSDFGFMQQKNEKLKVKNT